jgi:uncharacterized protein
VITERQEVMNEALRRIVAYFQPEKVYLIGSMARGDARPTSDIDFVVVVRDTAPKEQLFGGVYRSLRGLGVAVDVIPFRRTAFDERKDWLMSLPAIALRDGKLVYDAAQAA